MQKEFETYLYQICQCSPEKTFLLAVSGGIDSVVMAHLFQHAGLDFAFAHCNFQLRGTESDGDQAFVKSLAFRLKVPCYVSHFNTQAHADSQGISIQMAARELRYNWFNTLKEENGYDFIAVGHNSNDAVETVLLNLIRGSGIRGLCGIKPRQGAIVRPLLFASRSEIQNYADNHHIDWREDSSNAEVKYVRNRIRHVVIPELEAINQAFLPNALDTIARLSQTEQLLNLTVSNVKKSVWSEKQDKYLIEMDKLRTYPAVETLLYELLRDFGFTQPGIRAILASFDSTPGKRFYSQSHCVTRDRRHLIITRNTIPADDEILIDRETALITHPIHLSLHAFVMDPGYVIPTGSNWAALDADQLVFPLKLRRWKAGDSFRPFGMTGSKKISDYLINNKVPLPDKQHIRVIESGSNIVWLVNHRIDDRFRVTEKTRLIMQIEYKNTCRD